MVKCPYCHHENQEGTLYCEQCKSDLAPAGAPELASPVEGIAVANVVEGIAVAPDREEKLEPFAAVAEAIPVEAMPGPATAQAESAEEADRLLNEPGLVAP